MNDQVKIKVADLIGRPICISSEDGQKVFSKIEQLVKDKRQVIISFENVTMLIWNYSSVWLIMRRSITLEQNLMMKRG